MGGFYNSADLHVVYGYMQVGDILTSPKQIERYSWHPHSSYNRLINQTNALYVPSERLSLLPDLPGYGVLDYRQDRVLTMDGQSRGTWNAWPFLMPQHVCGSRKNSAKGAGLYYSGIWQELVIYESPGLIDWVKEILSE